MTEYIISEKALEDINNIWVYTAENWSVAQADRYYNLILDEIEYIAQNFEMARDFGKIRKSYKYSKVKSHLIFFKKDKKNEIEIVRVLHERMDIQNRLTE
ncbi:type II toxin-antitoxin system RelE/ParE family toxin [Flavobacterium foetidum]|uniref:type II toxin-antitoxin system RelE/ParE family toxin n=1 Tax=Flavobacterium foetidum TaxID=2026681 RepID=UPI0010750687|nr:type II toxin-antitoxin system RelE/ParE family toxin [Flavobacterium foetidum]KAF2517657.1 type II toxin-antitoxin system RelE/ParE family toxin [Flavobacterium foetidum]